MIDGHFFSPYLETDVHRRHLPHWQQDNAWCFVTWRLADSLPGEKLDLWRSEREAWLKEHPEPWDEQIQEEYYEKFSRLIDEWLDQGEGACVLRNPANAQIVANAFRNFNGKRYVISSFVIMPNHVHVLFRPLDKNRLADILKSWKGFTAYEINKHIGRSGRLWQEEYWDRLIRGEQHFLRCTTYIRNNPVKAGLTEREYVFENYLENTE